MQRLLTVSARIVTAYTAFVGVVVLLLGDALLGWFGQAPRAGYKALVIMVVAQMLNAVMGSITYLIGMTGHHVAGAVIIAASGVLCVLLNFAGVRGFGINGAAVATGLSLVLSSAVSAAYVKRRIGLRSTIV